VDTVGVLLVACLALGSQGARAQQAQGTRSVPAPLGLDEYYAVPADNPVTSAGIALGRRLFLDPLLSADRSIACASCHQPTHAFADTLALSRGVNGQHTLRNAPSILNRAYGKTLFWDGRAASLEEAVLQPIQNPREMALPLDSLVRRLRDDASYRAAFRVVFSGEEVTARNVARALSTYLRSLRSGGSAYDRYMNGDRDALSAEAVAGLRLFVGKANCSACHVPPTFTDERFHNTGVSASAADSGRVGVTTRPADRGKFKVPTLRNVALTAPYMHDGSLLTLEAVVELYERGGGPNPNLDLEIHALRLSPDEKRALIAFLRSLGAADNRHAP
jgi:cytochrome c peroxidase